MCYPWYHVHLTPMTPRKKLQMVAGVPTPRLDTLNIDRTLSARSVVGVSPCMIFNPLPYG